MQGVSDRVLEKGESTSVEELWSFQMRYQLVFNNLFPQKISVQEDHYHDYPTDKTTNEKKR